MKTSKYQLNIFLYGIAILVIAIAGCSSSAKPPADEKSPKVHNVQVEEVSATTEPLPIAASGVLASKSEVNLSFKVGGYIETILAEEGDNVKKGDLLARLNRAEIDAQVAKARNAFEKAKRDLKRIRDLYRDTVATLEQVQDLETAYEVARAELEIARFNQENATIHATADGRILKKYSERGEQVSPGTPVLRLGTTGAKSQILKFGVADRDVVRIQPGDSAQVRFDAFPDRIFQGEVTNVAAEADPRTGTFEIEVMLTNNYPELRNGFIGKVTLFPSGQAPYIRIPMDALVEANREHAFIYVPDESTKSAQKVKVQPFYIGESFFAVDTGELSASKVITRGASYLRPGANINITREGL
ncbi:efflux RND transporter periplasmic adaptor subunit [Aliifodinibius sp. S!AR15-10]|uniref:efflux RND transporter periplasmic adaptor subunit n=1 Tax=Aliifodinibius sp. S!AR15-10 TaxID=2950437 RepID=UPI00286057D2|nr:efflux RND transporter periplasmic adaptor subunit [Aliifodinibius sp. S!AR15-10]MDR8393993.1 efflux RND transporter periplasmic adaptor subunit [Aliifodinibius sp. S!AR15-10]